MFNLLVFATFAESLWRTLLDSGAEYGISIDATGGMAAMTERRFTSHRRSPI